MRSLKFLEQVSNFDEEGFESVSIDDAITALKIQELDMLKNIETMFPMVKITDMVSVNERVEQLEKELKHIKIK